MSLYRFFQRPLVCLEHWISASFWHYAAKANPHIVAVVGHEISAFRCWIHQAVSRMLKYKKGWQQAAVMATIGQIAIALLYNLPQRNRD